MDIPEKNDAIESFFETIVYVFSLRFLYDFLFKEWKTTIPSLK